RRCPLSRPRSTAASDSPRTRQCRRPRPLLAVSPPLGGWIPGPTKAQACRWNLQCLPRPPGQRHPVDCARLCQVVSRCDQGNCGESGEPLVVVDGIDTIDVSYLDLPLLGHSYIAESHSVIDDVRALLVNRVWNSNGGVLGQHEVTARV